MRKPQCECADIPNNEDICPVRWSTQGTFRACVDTSRPECTSDVRTLPASCNAQWSRENKPGASCSGFKRGWDDSEPATGNIRCNYCTDGAGYYGKNGDPCDGYDPETAQLLHGELDTCQDIR
jgi:hypothetical protein